MTAAFRSIWVWLGVLLFGWNLFWTFLIVSRESGTISMNYPYWMVHVMLTFFTTILLGMMLGLFIAELLIPFLRDTEQPSPHSPSVYAKAKYPLASLSKYGTMNDPEAL